MQGFPCGEVVKNPPANAGDAEDMDLIPGSGKPHGGGNEISPGVLAWKIPWIEEPAGL